ncbi:MAG: SDR family NAD(P)-dependent oxidoreductase [Candidatus Altimarinota bacterium]
MKRTALITGATHGIGYELAREFARHGYDLFIISRHLSALQRVARELKREFGVSVDLYASDLSQHDSPQKVFSAVQKKKKKIDVLINNAGFGLFGAFDSTDLEMETNMIHLNVLGLTHLTKLFIGPMRKRRSGMILNVASVAGFMPGPLSAVYFATKAYVLSFSQAIDRELEGTGIQVSALCPGATKTGFESRSEGAQTGLFKNNPSVMSPQEVALVAYRDFMKGKRLIIPGWTNKLQIFLLRFAPRSLVTKIVRRLLEK